MRESIESSFGAILKYAAQYPLGSTELVITAATALHFLPRSSRPQVILLVVVAILLSISFGSRVVTYSLYAFLLAVSYAFSNKNESPRKYARESETNLMTGEKSTKASRKQVTDEARAILEAKINERANKFDERAAIKAGR